MQNVFKRRFGLALLLLTATARSANAKSSGTSSAQFLKLGAGARAAGMGDAFVAVADDVTAAYWNPAGLAQIRQTEVEAMQNTSLVDTQYQYLGAAVPLRDSAIGFSMFRM